MVAAALEPSVAPVGFGAVPVPRLWPGSTIVCIGTGPSLVVEDVQACRGHKVIAIKDAIDLETCFLDAESR